mmetsp:Transcript_88122/g.224335  ORF Transcript_88122/g.224335 Transcript_88122/m.224335 type:complete len:234 (-) Transcript_88122:303-1004(-)
MADGRTNSLHAALCSPCCGLYGRVDALSGRAECGVPPTLCLRLRHGGVCSILGPASKAPDEANSGPQAHRHLGANARQEIFILLAPTRRRRGGAGSRCSTPRGHTIAAEALHASSAATAAGGAAACRRGAIVVAAAAATRHRCRVLSSLCEASADATRGHGTARGRGLGKCDLRGGKCVVDRQMPCALWQRRWGLCTVDFSTEVPSVPLGSSGVVLLRDRRIVSNSVQFEEGL